MLILPIRTESEVRRTPRANFFLIGANLGIYLLFNEMFVGPSLVLMRDTDLAFHSIQPAIYQFFTYQFLHGGTWHVLGNMLFLWVFGNSVNAKMGDLPYLLFYLAGGAFSAWGYALVNPDRFMLVGASGSIAAITTAYLALFPRARVKVLVWFFFIYFFEVSAMVVIGLKIIVWDNVVAPTLTGSGNVAHQAHLAGYLFGFAGASLMLLCRALPRDQYDIIALWKRWHKRRQFASAMADPAAAAKAQFGSVARTEQLGSEDRTAEDKRWEQLADMRSAVAAAVDKGDLAEATAEYQKLITLDPAQCLPERYQMAVAREYYSTGRFKEAAAAFTRFVASYPRSSELGNVRFLLGIILARDLREFEEADKYLTQTWEAAQDETRREQCFRWLSDVRLALGRPVPTR